MILSRGYKLRYVNYLVGVFVMLVLAVLFAAVVVVAFGQEWFVPRHELFAYLPEDELDGLQVNTPIQILGEPVGRVRDISYVEDPELLSELRLRMPWVGPDDRQFVRLTLQISDRAIDEIRADSRIYVRRRLAGVGEVYLEILRGRLHQGTPDETTRFAVFPERSPQDELRTMTQLMGNVQQDFAEMRESWVTAMESFDRTNRDLAVTNERVRELTESLIEVTPRMHEVADSIEQTNRDMQAASVQAEVTGRRFEETALALAQSNRQLQNVLADAEAVSPHWLPLTRQAERLLSTSQDVADRLQAETEDLPGTIGQVRDTVSDTQEMIDGLRQNWLLRRHLPQPEKPSRLPAGRVRVGGMLP